jgi:hypothetical protein
MKRLLFLSMCILLLGSTMVFAETVYVTQTRTSFSTSRDCIELHLAALVGDEVPQGQVISTILGTWVAGGTGTSTGTFSLPGTDASPEWYTTVTNNNDTSRAGPQTWINLSTRTPDVPWRHKADGSNATATTAYQFYFGSYNTPAGLDGIPNYALGVTDLTPGSDPDPIWVPIDDEEDPQYPGYYVQHPGYNFDNTLLGKFYVSKGTQWAPGDTIYTGIVNFQGAYGGSPHAGTVTTIMIQPVPEPSTLALLGCGLFGLLAYAWRKRK